MGTKPAPDTNQVRCPLWVNSGHDAQIAMSALPPTRDQDVCFGPQPYPCTAANDPIRSPRRRCEQRFRRHRHAECLGRLEVDDELELGRLHDRQVGGLGALEDVAGIDANLTITCPRGWFRSSSAHRLPQYHARISRRNPVARRQVGKLHAAAGEERVGSDEEGIGALARKGGKGRIDLPDSSWHADLLREPARQARTEASERPKIDPEFEEVTEGEEVERKEKLKTKWAQLEAVVGSENRVKIDRPRSGRAFREAARGDGRQGDDRLHEPAHLRRSLPRADRAAPGVARRRRRQGRAQSRDDRLRLRSAGLAAAYPQQVAARGARERASATPTTRSASSSCATCG